MWVQLGLTDFDPAQPVEAQDRLIAETSADGVSWGRRPAVVIANNSVFQRWLIDLSQLEGRSTGGLRFRLVTNASGSCEGVALDDVEVFCVPPLTDYTGARDEFAFDFGTSMAAPHVSGVAVLLLSLDSQLSAAELKQRILRSVDPVSGLAGRTVTGGRLNAARALGPAPSTPPARANEPHPSTDQPSPAWALKLDLRWLAQEIAKQGRRAVLRGGGFHADRLHALSPGRFTLQVKGPDGRTIARAPARLQAPPSAR